MIIATENSYVPSLLTEIGKCETWQAVEAAFDNHQITDRKKRMSYLCYCMGSPQVFFGGKENCDEEKELYSKYVTMLSMFVTGSWR